MRNLLLVLVALLVSAGVVEGMVRAAGFVPRAVRINPFFIPGTETTWSVPDPELGWINKPGVSRSIEQGGAVMTFWNFGRRASRPDPAPPADVSTPVMVIGGSNAQSYGVADTDSFVSLLAQRYPDVWFENFGNGGYSTVQALMLAERAMAKFYTETKPKVILLAFDDSHAERNVADQSWIFSISDSEGRYVAPPHYRLRGNTLVFKPFHTVGFWPLESRSAALTVLHNVWLQSFAYNTAGQALPVTARVLDRLDVFAAEHHAVLAVAVLEDRRQISGALLDGRAFPHIDCSEPALTDPKAYLLDGGSHPNAALHAKFADCVGPWLERDVLPRIGAAR